METPETAPGLNESPDSVDGVGFPKLVLQAQMRMLHMVIGITDTDRRWRTMGSHSRKPGQRSKLRPTIGHALWNLPQLMEIDSVASLHFMDDFHKLLGSAER